MIKSIFKKVNRDVLIEWTYDPNNVIQESYKILTDSRTGMRSYIGGDVTMTNNDITSQLVDIDLVQGKWSKIDLYKLTFLSVQDFTGEGVRHDRLKIYLPTNFQFGEHQGVYFKIYTLDHQNKKIFEISNFFFDQNDLQKLDILSTFTPPLLYQDRTWDKFIQVDIPSVYALALQRTDGSATQDSINYNLSGPLGLSLTSPIFIDFQFISKIVDIGATKTYITSQKLTTQVPQLPQIESLKLVIEESNRGDYFEIYPEYDGSFFNFVEFIESSKSVNKFYITEYTITLFEENVKGRPVTIRIETEEDFSQKIEWRPIIKYSSTKAIIDVEMKLINRVDGTIEIIKSAYGMMPDQLSKYLINLKKILIRDVFKPKIYSKKKLGFYGLDQLGKAPQPENRIKVPVPSLIDLLNIAAFSESATNRISQNKIENYHYMGKLKLGVRPFDNIFRFHISYKTSDSLMPLDLTNCQDIKLTFRNDRSEIEFIQYMDEKTSPKNGVCQFRVPESRFLDIKNLLNPSSSEKKISSSSLFYITTTNQGITNTIYSGMFINLDNISNLDGDLSNIPGQKPVILQDPNPSDGVAVVTRRRKDKIQTRDQVTSSARGKGFKTPPQTTVLGGTSNGKK
jgi:hypothetical protein